MRIERTSHVRGLALSTLLAVLLALVTMLCALRAIEYEPPRAPPGGLFRDAGMAEAEALIEQLAEGLIARQQQDGSFDPGEYTYEIERVASSALTVAALAHLHRRGWEARVDGLTPALARGLDYLKKRQIDTGAIGHEEPKDHWSQVDATSAGVLAFALAGRSEDGAALEQALGALKRFARAGLRNGWTRGLGIMTAARLETEGMGELLGGNPRTIADLRDLKRAPRDGPPQTSDWNVAEAISRVVLGLRKGVDPFPGQVALAVLDEPAEWNYPSSDCAAWWMQAWLVARSGSKEAGAWFGALRKVLAEEAVGKDGVIEGGWYANTLTQSAGAILAILAGLESQVVVR